LNRCKVGSSRSFKPIIYTFIFLGRRGRVIASCFRNNSKCLRFSDAGGAAHFSDVAEGSPSPAGLQKLIFLSSMGGGHHGPSAMPTYNQDHKVRIWPCVDPSKGHFKGDEAIFSLEEILCIIGLCEIIMNITSYIWIYFIYLYILSISNTCKIFY